VLYQVLERNHPLEKITSEHNLRSKVQQHMEKIIESAKQLYPEDFQRGNERNYFTGEDYSNQHGTKLDAQYRFARMLLNEKAGRPIFGMPTIAETQSVMHFAQSFYPNRPVRSYGEAQKLIREEFENFTPEMQQAYAKSKEATQAILIETF